MHQTVERANVLPVLQEHFREAMKQRAVARALQGNGVTVETLSALYVPQESSILALVALMKVPVQIAAQAHGHTLVPQVAHRVHLVHIKT